jgi:hypothetical protein
MVISAKRGVSRTCVKTSSCNVLPRTILPLSLRIPPNTKKNKNKPENVYPYVNSACDVYQKEIVASECGVREKVVYDTEHLNMAG